MHQDEDKCKGQLSEKPESEKFTLKGRREKKTCSDFYLLPSIYFYKHSTNKRTVKLHAMDSHSKDVRKILTTLLVAQGLGSAAITSLATIATIVGAELSGGAFLAGLTASSFQLGTAFGSIFWSLASDRLGWRGSLSSAVFVGALGAVGAVVGVLMHNFWFLLASLFVAASAQAAFNLGRFTAAEVSQPEKRGRAVALIVLGGTVGSVVGPQLITVSSQLAKNAGLSEWVGPYSVTAILFLFLST
jgi:MFS family permease